MSGGVKYKKKNVAAIPISIRLMGGLWLPLNESAGPMGWCLLNSCGCSKSFSSLKMIE